MAPPMDALAPGEAGDALKRRSAERFRTAKTADARLDIDIFEASIDREAGWVKWGAAPRTRK